MPRLTAAGPPLVRVALTGSYSFDGFKRLVTDLDPLARLDEPATVELDLSELTGLSAPASAWLTAVVRRVQRLDLVLHSTIVDAHAPLAPAISASVASARGRRAAPRHAAGEFHVVEQFHHAEELWKIVPRVIAALASSCGLEPGSDAAASLRVCVDELTENVLFHADSMIGGILAVRHVDGGRSIEIGIADTGVGIRSSLQHNPSFGDLADDVTATAVALQPLVTGAPQRNGGFGLAVARHFVEANGGLLQLRSGRASVHVGAAQRSAATLTHLPGTVVGLSINLDGSLSIDPVYEALREQFEQRLREQRIDAGRSSADAQDGSRLVETSADKPVAEVLARSSAPSHPDPIIRLGDDTFALGRYYPTTNPRHAEHPLSRLVLAAKKDPAAAETIAKIFATAAAAGALPGGTDIVVSVPPAPGRGDRLAPVRAAVASTLAARDGQGLIEMRHAVGHYKRLGPGARAWCNVDRFSAAPLAGERCMLIDDVINTGAQSDACRRALEAAGAGSVTVVVLAEAQTSSRSARAARRARQASGLSARVGAADDARTLLRAA